MYILNIDIRNLLVVGYKSERCMQNEHGLCEGHVLETIHGSKITRICECQCHDNMYQLARRTQATTKSQ
jgi:hypothetical protein